MSLSKFIIMYFRACSVAILEPSPNDCIAGSFTTKCNVERCYRKPGDLCEEPSKAEYSGNKCHPAIFGCGCDKKCAGVLSINGVLYSHIPRCMSIGKRSHPRFPFLNQFEDNNSVDYPIDNISEV